MKTVNRRPKTVDQKNKSPEKGRKEFSIPIYNSKGSEVESHKLSPELFDGRINKGVLYQAVRMYNMNRRGGNASTKTRTEVSGGGKKPWRQKGTGRARAGPIRSPLWRGGGIVFGPHPRDFHYGLPVKVKRRALAASLNSKLAENKIFGIASIVIDEPKTKRFKEIIDALKLKGTSLFVLDAIGDNIKRASRNLAGVAVKNYKDINAYDVMKSDNVVMTKASLEKLPERIKG